MKPTLNILYYFVLFINLSTIFTQTVNSQTTDFSSAFDSLHNTLNKQYAFSEWKSINWAELYAEFQPRIAEAEASDDSIAFFFDIKEYLSRIPDGHISLNGWGEQSWPLMYDQIGGSYGFSLIKLDDGKIVTRLVTENSPAAEAGIEFGAEIITFNNVEINEALENTSVLWADPAPATIEGKLLNQMRFIGRGRVGDNAEIEFINPGKSVSETVQLTAVEDEFETLLLTSLVCSTDDTTKVHYNILNPSGYGYLQLTSCGEESTTLPIYYQFHDAIQYFADNNVSGLILDLRINDGGDDWLAAAVASFFYSDTTLYEYISSYDPISDDFQIYEDYIPHINSQTMELYTNENYPLGSLFIEPPELRFKKPVVVMNSARQISSGEGVAMALQKLPNCEVVSLYGSQGSFGIIQDESSIWLFDTSNPLVIGYPSGRSLDINQNIQVDSDQNMIGGVIPDNRPALDAAAINEMFLQEVDYELNYAIERLHILVNIEESEQNNVPGKFKLQHNYPNPFNPTTVISYQLPVSGNVTLKVYDVLGKEVATLVDRKQETGTYEVAFDASKLASGIYIYRLLTDNFAESKPMVLLK